MSSDTVAVGIVGCGNIGRTHAEAYERLEDTEVVAAADLHEPTLSAFVEEFDVDAGFESHSEMLAETDLDLVSVCTLHTTHAQITIDAAEAGVPGVYCEKPMAVSLGQARDMLDAAENNDTKLTIGHMRRYNPNHEKAKALIESGAIGEPVQVAARTRGGLLNNATHVIDTILYVLDEPDLNWITGQVERLTDRHERGLPIEDACTGQLCFEDGLRMSFECDTPGPDSKDARIQITGTEGSLAIDLSSSITLRNDEGVETFEEDASHTIQTCIDAHLDWQAGEVEDHRVTGELSYQTMEIMMGIYESARRDRVIETPIETRANPLLEMIESGDRQVEHPGAYDIRLPYASVRMDE